MPDKREQTISAAAKFVEETGWNTYEDFPVYSVYVIAATFHLAQSSHEQARISELEAKLAAYEEMVGNAHYITGWIPEIHDHFRMHWNNAGWRCEFDCYSVPPDRYPTAIEARQKAIEWTKEKQNDAKR